MSIQPRVYDTHAFAACTLIIVSYLPRAAYNQPNIQSGSVMALSTVWSGRDIPGDTQHVAKTTSTPPRLHAFHAAAGFWNINTTQIHAQSISMSNACIAVFPSVKKTRYTRYTFHRGDSEPQIGNNNRCRCRGFPTFAPASLAHGIPCMNHQHAVPLQLAGSIGSNYVLLHSYLTKSHAHAKVTGTAK